MHDQEPELVAQEPNQDVPRQRPDPTFKRVTEKLIIDLHIKSKPTELKIKQLTSPDLFWKYLPVLA